MHINIEEILTTGHSPEEIERLRCPVAPVVFSWEFCKKGPRKGEKNPDFQLEVLRILDYFGSVTTPRSSPPWVSWLTPLRGMLGRYPTIYKPKVWASFCHRFWCLYFSHMWAYRLLCSLQRKNCIYRGLKVLINPSKMLNESLNP